MTFRSSRIYMQHQQDRGLGNKAAYTMASDWRAKRVCSVGVSGLRHCSGAASRRRDAAKDVCSYDLSDSGDKYLSEHFWMRSRKAKDDWLWR